MWRHLRPKPWKQSISDPNSDSDIWTLFLLSRNMVSSPSKPSMDYLNNQHASHHSTHSWKGVDGGISVWVHWAERNSTSVCTSVLWKKIYTNHYINLNSYHHPRILIGVIKCPRDRADWICHNSRKKQELEHLEQVLWPVVSQAPQWWSPCIRNNITHTGQ